MTIESLKDRCLAEENYLKIMQLEKDIAEYHIELLTLLQSVRVLRRKIDDSYKFLERLRQ